MQLFFSFLITSFNCQFNSKTLFKDGDPVSLQHIIPGAKMLIMRDKTLKWRYRLCDVLNHASVPNKMLSFNKYVCTCMMYLKFYAVIWAHA